MSEPLYRDRYSAEDEAEILPARSEGNHKFKAPVVEHRRRVHPVFWIILGFLLNLLLVGGLVWWLVGSSPAKLTPPPANNPAVTNDLNVRVGQDYINREISRALQQNPLNAFGVASISGLSVSFEPSSQMSVTVRLNTLGRDFDFAFKDSVAAVNQKVVLTQSGDVQLALIGLPISALNQLVTQVNTLVEDEINRQVGAGQPGDCLTCTNLGRVPSLKSLTTEQGVLVAQFDIKIE
ncbi:MAG: hypothetical protein J0I20_06740 [Chloroflexi bacterium]|nr:hypothetical protein [Chloroflexota bacterium]OJV95127.1 MAG: hypothetical protein BGO39_24235 [Chloroflexi bacterium 54-19]